MPTNIKTIKQVAFKASTKAKKKSTATTTTPNTQLFLNSLLNDTATMFKKAIYDVVRPSYLINHRHIYPPIDPDELETMKSNRPQDGAYLVDWMKCYILQEHLDNPPQNHPMVKLSLGSVAWPSVQNVVDEFCRSKSITNFKLQHHHVVLRSIEDQLPLLSTRSSDSQASHLCDTIGCLSEKHLVAETAKLNADRKLCDGIFVHIHRDAAGNSRIFQVEPCEHGRDHEFANGDPYIYSCRKIKITTTSDSKLPFLCG